MFKKRSTHSSSCKLNEKEAAEPILNNSLNVEAQTERISREPAAVSSSSGWKPSGKQNVKLSMKCVRTKQLVLSAQRVQHNHIVTVQVSKSK